MREYKMFSKPKDVELWVNSNYTESELKRLSVSNNIDTPLADYKGGGYRLMNGYLRIHEEDKQNDFDIQGLQEFLLSKTIGEPIVVFRFVDIKELGMLWWNTRFGKTFKYSAFLSTTMLKDHYSMENIRKNRFLITINVPQGTNGTYLPEVNSKMPEYEILLPYHTKLKRIGFMTFEVEGA